MKVLVTAASMHGATAEIAQAIGRELSAQGLTVTVLPPEDITSVEEYDAVVIGSAVYVGHWLDAAKDLVNRCRDALVTRPVWLFSSGPVGDPAGKLARAMDTDPADAVSIRVATGALDHQMFAGRLDRKLLTRPSGYRCWSSAAWRETSATGPRSVSGPTASRGSSPPCPGPSVLGVTLGLRLGAVRHYAARCGQVKFGIRGRLAVHAGPAARIRTARGIGYPGGLPCVTIRHRWPSHSLIPWSRRPSRSTTVQILA